MGELDVVQSLLVSRAMEIAWLVAELGGATGAGNRRKRLLKRLAEKKEQINSLARDLVALMGPEITGKVHESEILEIRNVVGEPMAFYYLDTNAPIGIFAIAPTAELAREVPKRIVERFRDGTSRLGPKGWKKFIDGNKEIVIKNVYYICDLREAAYGDGQKSGI